MQATGTAVGRANIRPPFALACPFLGAARRRLRWTRFAHGASSRESRMKDRQQPILGLVRNDVDTDLDEREGEVCRDVADTLEAFAITLPSSSEVRALLLRSAGRFAVAGGLASPSHLRLARPAAQTG